MKGIKCIAPVFDVSGYAEWARHYILALIRNNVPVTIGTDLIRKTGKPITFEPNQPDLGNDGEILKQYVGKQIEYDTVISWLTPEMAYEQMSCEMGVKKINMTLWETDTLPDAWHQFFMYVDEVWVPGEWNRKIFTNSFKKFAKEHQEFSKLASMPVRSIPLPLNVEKFKAPELGDTISFPDMPENSFYFYFISQWNRRKNFTDLVEAYCHEFTAQDSAVLVLKTYMFDGTTQDRDKINAQLNQMMIAMNKPNVPRIALIHGNLSSVKMLALHKCCDCYVSPSRGEGLGLGMLEASMLGNPVICNSFGEHNSFLTDDNAFVYKHSLSPVGGMGHMNRIYTINQCWASPDVKDLASTMRRVYNSKEEYLKSKANKAKNRITQLYNDKKVVSLILEHLK